MVLIMWGKHCCVVGCHNNSEKYKSTGNRYVAFQKNGMKKRSIHEGTNWLFDDINLLSQYFTQNNFSAIVSSLNCNNFGSNKGIVIKLIVMWSVTYYLSLKPISCGNFVEVPTAGLPTIFSITIMGCGGAGLSRDHLYTVGPGPKLHLVAVTKSRVIHFD